MHRSTSHSKLRHQRGGVAILLAISILAIMSVGAFSLASTSLRELTTTGNVMQGSKAAEAADAGLDWFVVWAHPDNVKATLGNTTAAGLLADAMTGLRSDTFATYPYKSGISFLGGATDRVARISSSETAMSTSGMVFANNDGLVTQNAAGGNKIIQRFDLTVRFLGFQPVALTGGGGQAAGGTNPNAAAAQDLLWLASSDGYASVDTGSGYIRFNQRRDMVGLQALSQ